ncbi:MAG: ParB/RepB/Spo0J family partition protein [Christensenellaceae bacterium]|nr:ParB/RepB/Spo0J family partition protein [Christensenellaceae bacterium]
MKAKGLGKGLGALIGDAQTAIIEDPRAATEIDVNRIDVCKTQPRKNFDPEKLKELAASIKKYGVIQPLVVNKTGDRYTIIAGERRYRASRLAGLKKVPVIVKDMEAKDVLQVSIIENIQREDLNPMEEAMAISMLMEQYGFTQEKVAEGIGKSRSAVANALRLLSLPKKVTALVEDGTLSAGHARPLIALKDEESICKAAAVVAERGMSVRETEQYVKAILEDRPKVQKKEKPRDPDMALAERQLADALETKISLTGNGKKGKIVIEYFSKEQLDAIYSFLMQAKK